VFDSNGNGAPNGHDIFVMNADGTGITRLDTPVPAADLDPSWQPIANVPPADTVAPVLSLPAGLTVEATGPGGAAVAYSVSATDAVDPAPAVTCTPVSGSVFPLGEWTVTCTAADAAGNQSTGSFAVRVVDTAGPVISLPAGLTVEATGPGGAPVTYTVSATDAVHGAASVACAPPSGSTFALGATKVTCTATDAAGNPASAAFVVDVVDTTPPLLELEKLTTRVVQGWEFFGTSFSRSSFFPDANYPAGASDLVDPSPVVTCDPPPDARLPVGSTKVLCTATDFSGNTSIGEVELVVLGPREALERLITVLQELGLLQKFENTLLTPLERARIAYQKGAMPDAEKALEEFVLELDKQSRKGLSSEAAAKLGAGIRPMLGGVFPTGLSQNAEKLRRLHEALGAAVLATIRVLVGSALGHTLSGDRRGALKDLRDAKAALPDVRDKLTAKDAADLERDLDAAIASLEDPKGAAPKG
jgi:hypothetical protein